MIISRWQLEGGRIHNQECATADVARSVMKSCRNDPAVRRAWAYYADADGTSTADIETYERVTPSPNGAQ